MAEERKQNEPDERQTESVSEDELGKQEGEPLPDREVMTILPVPDPTGLPPGPATIEPFNEPPVE